MDLQRRCDPQPPGAPQEDVALLLSCSLSFLSVSTCLSCSFSSFVSNSFHPPPHLFGPQVPPACLHVLHPQLLLGLCASFPVTRRLSTLQDFSLSFLCCYFLSSSPAFLSLHLSWVCPSLSSGSLPKLATASSVAARPLLVHMKFTHSDAGHLVSLPRCLPSAFLPGKPPEAREKKTLALRLDARSL